MTPVPLPYSALWKAWCPVHKQNWIIATVIDKHIFACPGINGTYVYKTVPNTSKSPCPSKPNCWQATVASRELNFVSQTVLITLLKHTSSLPSLKFCEVFVCMFASLRSPWVQLLLSVSAAVNVNTSNHVHLRVVKSGPRVVVSVCFFATYMLSIYTWVYVIRDRADLLRTAVINPLFL